MRQEEASVAEEKDLHREKFPEVTREIPHG
jgi:hypothetical protein